MIKIIINLDEFTYKAYSDTLEEIKDEMPFFELCRKFFGNNVNRIIISIKGDKENDKN